VELVFGHSRYVRMSLAEWHLMGGWIGTGEPRSGALVAIGDVSAILSIRHRARRLYERR
jgi:hypothetical protein